MSFINWYGSLCAKKQASRSSKRLAKWCRDGKFDHPRFQQESDKLTTSVLCWMEANNRKKLILR